MNQKTNKELFRKEREAYLRMSEDIFVFIDKCFGLVPQVAKPKYQGRWKLILELEGDDWETAKEMVKPEWFGEFDEDTLKWEWYEFKKGVHVSWQQTLILASVNKAVNGGSKNRLSIASGHGIGKTAVISLVVLWFLFGRPGSQVAATAPSAQQMYDVMWKELSIWISKIKIPLVKDKFQWNKDYIRMLDTDNSEREWFARAKTASKENPEALAGIHADNVMMLADEACHDDKTEILTEEGWKLFKDLNRKERVLTMNPKTEKANYELPTKYHEYDGEREMIVLNKRGTDFMVTSNHDMFVKTKYKGWRKKKAGEFISNSDYFYKKTINWDGSNSMSSEMVQLYAWFLSEGSIVWYPDRNKGPRAVTISQSMRYNSENYYEIIRLIEKLGYTYTKTKKEIIINDVTIARELSKCGFSSLTKRVPNEIKSLNSHLLNVFIDTYTKGDGYNKGVNKIIYTSGKGLADDIQEIALKTGVNCTIKERDMRGEKKWIVDHYGTTRHINYVLNISRKESFGKINGKELEKVKYKGRVYCVTVPNGLILTRRNGYVMWSGNSGVEDAIYNTMEGALTSGSNLIVLISNPTRISGYFYNTHNKHKDKWQRFKFSSIDSPLVADDYEQEQADLHGRGSEQYGIRVLGQFPSDDAMDDKGFLPLIAERSISSLPLDNLVFRKNSILGVDPAGEGDDKTVIFIRDEQKAQQLWEESISNEKTIAEKVMTFVQEYNLDYRNVVVDDFGSVGAKVAAEIAIATAGKGRITAVNVGDQCDYEDEKDMFENKRAYMFWKLREWSIKGGLVDDRAHQEIQTIRYKRNIRGKIQIMSKLLMKKLYSYASPNKADALALTFLRDIKSFNDEEIRKAIQERDQLDFDPFQPV